MSVSVSVRALLEKVDRVYCGAVGTEPSPVHKQAYLVGMRDALKLVYGEKYVRELWRAMELRHERVGEGWPSTCSHDEVGLPLPPPVGEKEE